MTFFTEALPSARSAHSQTGVLTSVILAQWADEQGYRWPPEGNNPGNVGSFDGQPIHTFPTLAQGVAAYVQAMNTTYASVARQVGSTNQCYNLGAHVPVYASSRYEEAGGPPGEDLVKIIAANDLTQYDGAPIPPEPPKTQGDDVTSLVIGTQTHVWGFYNGQPVHWWQDAAPGPNQNVWHYETLPLP